MELLNTYSMASTTYDIIDIRFVSHGLPLVSRHHRHLPSDPDELTSPQFPSYYLPPAYSTAIAGKGVPSY